MNSIKIRDKYSFASLFINRIQFYLKLYKGENFFGSLLVYIFLSFLLFQENQIFGGAIILFHIHFTRHDTTLLKIAYGDNYFIALVFEYFLIYLPFVIFGLIISDPLIYFSPIVFFVILMIFYTLPHSKSINNNRFKIFSSLVSSSDFIWKSGVRNVEMKFWVIFLLTIPLMIGTRNPYIFPIFLFCFGLISNRFYNNEISEYLLDVINTNRRYAIKQILKQNIFSYIKITILPFIIQLILFYNEKYFFFFVSSYFVMPILLFQFLVLNIKTYKEKRSTVLLQLINGFSIVSILFPPLSIVSLMYSLGIFNSKKEYVEN